MDLERSLFALSVTFLIFSFVPYVLSRVAENRAEDLKKDQQVRIDWDRDRFERLKRTSSGLMYVYVACLVLAGVTFVVSVWVSALSSDDPRDVECTMTDGSSVAECRWIQ